MTRKYRFLSVCFYLCVCIFTNTVFAARTAVKHNAVDMGTKVAVATEMKSSSCADKYAACMDNGCMIDNESGGRCQCSNKFKELNIQYNKLIAKDYATEQIAKFGTELVEMGDMADELLAKTSDNDVVEVGRMVVPDGEYGEDLRTEMHDLCMTKLSECKSQLPLMKSLYSQKIKSDCAAFENAINDKNQKSKEQRASAKKTVRKAALDQYQASNKYNLGQCATEFGKCMKTTGECGEDWSGCVGRLGIDKMYTNPEMRVTVVGPNSSVMIAASTMEILESKKMMCEHVTKECVAVKDQVWDVFLKNTIPEIKSAESLVESDARSSCLINISNCFVNACKDNIAGQDKDSYDYCLTHPESVKSFCKVELEPCLAATGGSLENPENSTLWPSVLAKLAAMRVDACTLEVKECIQSADRCGSDYTQCIGLDTNIIVRMCPYEKLVACQKVYGKEETKGEEIYDALARIVDGLLLNIDNNILQACQAKVEEAMTKVCGDPESCAAFAINDDTLGTKSLKYQICQYSTDSANTTEGFNWFDCRSDLDQISDYELGRDKYSRAEMAGPITPFAGVISGTINWASVQINADGFIDIDSYLSSYKDNRHVTKEEKARIRNELLGVQQNINRTIELIEKDEWVSFCVSGREVPGVTDLFSKNKVRFPKLANTIRRQIATAALQRARANYFVVYDELSERMSRDLVKINERVANNIRENGKDALARAAQAACQGIAAESAFAKAPVGQSIWAKVFLGVIIIIAIIVACIFTVGAAAGPIGGGIVASISSAGAAAAASVSGAVGGAVAGSVASAAGSIGAAASAAGATGVAAGATGAAAGAAAGVAAVSGAVATGGAIGGAAAGVGAGAAAGALAGAAAVGGTAAVGAAVGGTAGAIAGGITGAITAATAVGFAAASAGAVVGSVYAIGKSMYDQQQAVNKQKLEAEKMRQDAAWLNSDDNHGEYVAVDWNYMEIITTDFDRETMTCKRCIKFRKCSKTKWSLFVDRYCESWGGWQEGNCVDLKF